MKPTFFTDRDLGKSFPSILRQAGLAIVTHGELFADNEADVTWLNRVGAQGWFAISRDKRIRYRPNEVRAVTEARVGLFVVIGNAGHQELATNFVKTFSRVERFIERTELPFIAKVHRPTPSELLRNQAAPGRVELWFPRAD